ncbi:MAG TPA: sugar ABC transporter permease [Thermomicrobiales bacterium]|jgi:N-acetylglucosamine transport system permease protein|nr:sugar ABC transporter permease [Thermomicrobiales bacterium]
MHHQRYRLVIPFMLPALILYGVFVLYPYVQSFYVSLTDWRGMSDQRPWTGFSNYQRLAEDGNFTNALGNNAFFLLVIPLITISLALLFATLFTQGARGVPGSSFYRIVFFFPQILSIVIIGVLFKNVYKSTGDGLLNGVLRFLGFDQPVAWLGDPTIAIWAIAAVVIWQGVGFYMVLFIAGIQGIPDSFFEAATLDGAGRFTQFRTITLPLIWENIRVGVVYIAIAALDMFALVQVMTAGGPNRSTEVIALYMYDRAFTRSLWGYATAMGVVLLLLTLILSLITLRASRRDTYEY